MQKRRTLSNDGELFAMESLQEMYPVRNINESISEEEFSHKPIEMYNENKENIVNIRTRSRRYSCSDVICESSTLSRLKRGIKLNTDTLPPIRETRKSKQQYEFTTNKDLNRELKLPRIRNTFTDFETNMKHLRGHSSSIEEEPPSQTPVIKLKVHASSEFHKVLLEFHELKLK